MYAVDCALSYQIKVAKLNLRIHRLVISINYTT